MALHSRAGAGAALWDSSRAGVNVWRRIPACTGQRQTRSSGKAGNAIQMWPWTKHTWPRSAIRARFVPAPFQSLMDGLFTRRI